MVDPELFISIPFQLAPEIITESSEVPLNSSLPIPSVLI